MPAGRVVLQKSAGGTRFEVQVGVSSPALSLATTQGCRDGWRVVWEVAAKPSIDPFPSGNLTMEGVLV